MNRAGQMLLGLIAATAIMGGVYLIYTLAGGPEAQKQKEAQNAVELSHRNPSDYEALETLQSHWDGNSTNSWTHNAQLDSFGVKPASAEGGVDSLVVKGHLDDTVRIITVPLNRNDRWQSH